MTTSTQSLVQITEAERRPLWLMGAVLEVVIGGDQTGGAYYNRWQNVGDGPGRHLEIVVPAGLERMFEEIEKPVDDPNAAPPPVDPKRLLAAAPR